MDYYLINSSGSQGGPYSGEQIRAMWSSGAINLETLLWTEGMPNWQPLREIEDSIHQGAGNESSVPNQRALTYGTNSSPDPEPTKPSTASPNSDSTVHGKSWQELVAPPLINGASGVCLSTIMMGIDSMERDDYEGGINLFRDALAQNHTVASAWLGIAYAEALLVSKERNSLDSISIALSKVHEFLPRTQQIYDHEGLIWTAAFSKAGLLTATAYCDALSSLSSAKLYSDSVQANTSGRNGAIAIAVAGAVLGGGSAGLIGKVLGYGISAAETYRAINSHSAIKSGERAIGFSANQFAASCELGLNLESLVISLVKEAEDVYPNCSPEIQQIIHDCVTNITSKANEITKDLAAVQSILQNEGSKKPQATGCGRTFLVIVIAVVILIGFILVLSLLLGNS